MPPLVSVMMPCFNSARTLPMALASLIAQTYEDWECVLVDDGSTDDPKRVTDRADDARIRCIRFDENRGRGVARQAALDAARGDYLTMLDADDWIFPDKIEKQVDAMTSDSRLALVSTGMSITDESGSIVGVRCADGSGHARGPFVKLAMPPIAHAPSMIRMEIAKKAVYDPRFLLAQDVDFLLQVLLDRHYAVLPGASYIYSEHLSVNSRKIEEAGRYVRQMFLKHKARFPVACMANVVKSHLKSVAYKCLFGMGFGKWVIGRRSLTPTDEQADAYELAKAEVSSVRDRVFGLEE